MQQRMRLGRAAVVTSAILALILGGCGPASTSDSVEAALVGLGAGPSERTCDNSENDSHLAQVIDSTSCWSIEIETSIPDTTMDVVGALQELKVAGEIEFDLCADKDHGERAYLPCDIRFLPRDGHDDVLFVHVGAAIPANDDPDEWARQGAPGTRAEVVVGVGSVVEFSSGEWVNEEIGASIRLDDDGGGEVSAVPVWTADPAECDGREAARFDGEIEWSMHDGDLFVTMVSSDGVLAVDAEPLDVVGRDWRMIQYPVCDGTGDSRPYWFQFWRDDA